MINNEIKLLRFCRENTLTTLKQKGEFMKKILIISLVLLLFGCSSIPLNRQGISVNIDGNVIVDLNLCAYSDELKLFICPNYSVRDESDGS